MQIKDYPRSAIADNDLILFQAASDGAYKSISNSNLKANNSTGSATRLFIQLLDQRTSGTAGGNATQNAWSVRPLNTIQKDDTGLVTLANNAFILPSGIYEINAKAAFYNLYNTKMRLQNSTDGISLVYGLISTFNPSGGAVGTQHLTGKFTIAQSKTLMLQYFTVSGGNNSQYNFGGSVGDGSPEIYAVVDLWKVG